MKLWQVRMTFAGCGDTEYDMGIYNDEDKAREAASKSKRAKLYYLGDFNTAAIRAAGIRGKDIL